MESTEMRRSTLQRKDREELTEIASQLGKKPPSRARKGEIIDLILDLAAGGDGSSVAMTSNAMATNGEPGDAESAANARESTAADADRAAASDEAVVGGDRDKKADEASGDRGRDDQADEASGDRGRDDQADEASGDRGRDDQGRDRDDQPEPGNRRRRRRGRDRDRDNRGSGDAWSGDPTPVSGNLDLRDEGYGFLRVNGYLPSKNDAYVPVKIVRQYGLRKGDAIAGTSRPANRSEKNPALVTVEMVNGGDPENTAGRPNFDDLTPLFPDERLIQEMPRDPSDMTARIVDLIAPIGKGQRGLIVSPPKAGKTTIMKNIVRSIETNDPDVHVIVLLVDERPEEVTDMRRWVDRGEVVASTFDRPAEEHTIIAEMTIERAKRMVEEGKDVFIVLDGITRLARAYNLAAPATGRIMSGGIDTGALYPPKKFFGAARNVEEGGSLTILATALVETGSKMDEVIFEEFKGTGNMELRLDRRAAERRIFPAIDVDGSSTRHEELLFEREQLDQVWKLRRVLSGMSGEDAKPAAGLELLIDRLGTFKNNNEFLAEVAKGPVG